MELRGNIIEILPEESGVSKAGKEWARQEFVIETIEQYPRKICLHVLGQEKIDQLSNYRIGYDIICQIRVESREYNGRWYTQVYAYNFQGTANNKPK